MRYLLYIAVFVISWFPVSAQQSISGNKKPVREVAVTVDDLPATIIPSTIDELKQNTKNLLSAFTRYKVPATGFVNESKLYNESGYIQQRGEVLKMWLDEGMHLGNHTYSHKDLNTTPLEEFEQDVIKGELITKKLLAEKGMKPEYFRHPFLHAGNTAEKKNAFENFLSERGYKAAPVTIDNSEWIFARAYLNAKTRCDSSMMKKVAGEYVEYMEKKFEYFEKQSVELFGREIKQVLLIHANELNADHFDALAGRLESRGYHFISLSEALKDSAYNSPDTYTGKSGITWLHRWAITRKMNKEFYKGEPLTPEYILKEAGVESE